MAIAILSGLLIYRVLLVFSYNGEVGGIDNNLVYYVARSINGSAIYTHPASAPYSITLYSPLYINLCSAIGALLHINPDNAIQVYQLCRGVSLVNDIVTIFFLYIILKRRFNVSGELSWLATACFGCILCILGYTFSRPDSLYLSFYAAFIYTITDPTLLKRTMRLLLPALLTACCIFSKQNGIILPVLATSWLLVQGSKKAAAYYLLFFIAIGGAALLLYFTIYPDLASNTISSIRNRIDLRWFYSDIFKRMMNSLWVLPVYFAAAISIKEWIKPSSREERAFAAVFIIQLAFSFLTSLKFGSSAGYFNESFFLAFIILARRSSLHISGTGLSYLKKIIAILLPLIFLFFAHILLQGYLFFIQHRDAKKIRYQQQMEIRDYLRPRINQGYVMNLAEPNENFFKVLFYKEIAVPNTDMVDCCTLPDKTFDYSNLQRDLSDGTIAFLITNEADPVIEIWNIPLSHYSRDTVIHGFAIYSSGHP